MIIALKIITSCFFIVLITEVAKKHSVMGGLMAVLPINILLSITWLYIETRDVQLLQSFTYSAIWGLIPTVIFLVVITYLFSKQNEFGLSVATALIVLAVMFCVQQKLLIGNNIKVIKDKLLTKNNISAIKNRLSNNNSTNPIKDKLSANYENANNFQTKTTQTCYKKK